MVDTTFTLISGTYADEQGLLKDLDFFMTQTVGGWVQDTVITDTASDFQAAYYTDGSVVGFYDRCWVLLRGTADVFRLFGVSDWDGSNYLDGFGGNADNIEVPVGTGAGVYWFMVNRDAVHVVVKRDSDGNAYHCGCGLFDSYYTRQEDPRPLYVFGQVSPEHTFGGAVRLRGYGPQSFGTSYSVLASGVDYAYKAAHPTLVAKGTPNPRSGEPKLIEPVFYTEEAFGGYEVRGEVPGLYMCGGSGYDHGNFMTITGTLGTTAGNYFLHKYSDDVAWAIGPVTVSGEG